jgi:hypothetical protein
VALTLNNLAVLAAERGDHERASTLAAQAYRILDARVAPDHPVLASLANITRRPLPRRGHAPVRVRAGSVRR